MKTDRRTLMRILKEELSQHFSENLKEERFAGGSIDVDPLSDEEQDASTDAYYDLRSFLEADGPWVDAETGRSPAALPGGKPSEKLINALRWIAKFEKEGIATRAHQAKLDDAPAMGRFVRGLKEETDASGMSAEMHDALEAISGPGDTDGEVENTPTQSGGTSLTEGYKRLTQLAGVRRTKNES